MTSTPLPEQGGFNERLDEFLDEALSGLYIRDEDGNFMPIHDKYDVLRNNAKEVIRAAIDQATPEKKDFSPTKPMNDVEAWFGAGYNQAIHDYKANLERELFG